MAVSGVMTFETALGWCGFAWTDAGLARVRLPLADRAAALEGLARRDPDAAHDDPPAAILAAANAVRGLFAGRGGTLAEVPLDLAGVPTSTAAPTTSPAPFRPARP
jgi:methylated-DNA-[protein]-cysteine S-methyltransferase